MNLKRTATIVVVGTALAAWLAAAATSGRRSGASAPAASPSPLDARGERLASEIAKLHHRLRPDAEPSRSRNPFKFASSIPRASFAHSLPLPRDSVAVAPPAALPFLRLIGVAEDAGADGTVARTAIVAGADNVFLVKEGDALADRYRVVRISADALELSDTSDGGVLRLALK
jgi:hypothetical protein